LTFQQDKETLKHKIIAQPVAKVPHARHVISQSVQTRAGMKLTAVTEQKSLSAEIMCQNNHHNGSSNYDISPIWLAQLGLLKATTQAREHSGEKRNLNVS
jgi:uncharacterized lipoprotein YddW (UPF0748 family)